MVRKLEGFEGPSVFVFGNDELHDYFVAQENSRTEEADTEAAPPVEKEREATTLVVAPIEIECPACQAKPGEPCTQPNDNGRKPVRWFHLSREDRALGWEASEDKPCRGIGQSWGMIQGRAICPVCYRTAESMGEFPEKMWGKLGLRVKSVPRHELRMFSERLGT
jgi:hypothetical protein